MYGWHMALVRKAWPGYPANLLWHHWDVDSVEWETRLRASGAQYKRAKAAMDRARLALREDAAAALRDGVRPHVVVKSTGLSDETVRQISRAAGLPPLREATVVSKRQAESGQG